MESLRPLYIEKIGNDFFLTFESSKGIPVKVKKDDKLKKISVKAHPKARIKMRTRRSLFRTRAGFKGEVERFKTHLKGIKNYRAPRTSLGDAIVAVQKSMDSKEKLEKEIKDKIDAESKEAKDRADALANSITAVQNQQEELYNRQVAEQKMIQEQIRGNFDQYMNHVREVWEQARIDNAGIRSQITEITEVVDKKIDDLGDSNREKIGIVRDLHERLLQSITPLRHHRDVLAHEVQNLQITEHDTQREIDRKKEEKEKIQEELDKTKKNLDDAYNVIEKIGKSGREIIHDRYEDFNNNMAQKASKIVADKYQDYTTKLKEKRVTFAPQRAEEINEEKLPPWAQVHIMRKRKSGEERTVLHIHGHEFAEEKPGQSKWNTWAAVLRDRDLLSDLEEEIDKFRKRQIDRAEWKDTMLPKPDPEKSVDDWVKTALEQQNIALEKLKEEGSVKSEFHVEPSAEPQIAKDEPIKIESLEAKREDRSHFLPRLTSPEEKDRSSFSDDDAKSFVAADVAERSDNPPLLDFLSPNSQREFKRTETALNQPLPSPIVRRLSYSEPPPEQAISAPEEISAPASDSSEARDGKGSGYIDEKGLGKDSLSTSQIDMIMADEPAYMGTIAADQVLDLKPRLTDNKMHAFVMNLDPSFMSGSHWVSVVIDPKKERFMYYDSFARPPPEPIINDFKTLVRERYPDKRFKFKWNQVPHQNKRTDTCGYHAIVFINNILKKKSFQDASGYKKFIAGKGQINEREADIREFKKKLIPFKYF